MGLREKVSAMVRMAKQGHDKRVTGHFFEALIEHHSTHIEVSCRNCGRQPQPWRLSKESR